MSSIAIEDRMLPESETDEYALTLRVQLNTYVIKNEQLDVFRNITGEVAHG